MSDCLMTSEIELRKHSCCFTGHRPEKIIVPKEEVMKELKIEIQKSIEEGFSTFISGMARGVDLWAAETIIQLRESGAPIKLICAVPYKGFEERWKEEWQKQYNLILQKADLTKYICEGYSKSCFQIRNEWMVNHSAKVIAVYTGEAGGTKNTIMYAQKHGVTVKNILN